MSESFRKRIKRALWSELNKIDNLIATNTYVPEEDRGGKSRFVIFKTSGAERVNEPSQVKERMTIVADCWVVGAQDAEAELLDLIQTVERRIDDKADALRQDSNYYNNFIDAFIESYELTDTNPPDGLASLNIVVDYIHDKGTP